MKKVDKSGEGQMRALQILIGAQLLGRELSVEQICKIIGIKKQTFTTLVPSNKGGKQKA